MISNRTTKSGHVKHRSGSRWRRGMARGLIARVAASLGPMKCGFTVVERQCTESLVVQTLTPCAERCRCACCRIPWSDAMSLHGGGKTLHRVACRTEL
jgi:hypothetical protein